METETVSVNGTILEKIRGNIIIAMKYIDLLVNVDYKLSQAKSDRTTFTIELMRKGISQTKIRNSIKSKFDNAPDYKPSNAFIMMDFRREYDYLAG